MVYAPDIHLPSAQMLYRKDLERNTNHRLPPNTNNYHSPPNLYPTFQTLPNEFLHTFEAVYHNISPVPPALSVTKQSKLTDSKNTPVNITPINALSIAF